ncbi:MAG: phosphate propanoyltransferase [Candidatus Latescibacteria bacterium]|nr:phosphate propanoyltransferase [Candidatus Latescibacterota bacterium]
MTSQSPPAAQQHQDIESLVRQAVYRTLPEAQLSGLNEAARAISPVPRLVASISARHIHVDQAALETLFGTGSQLTVLKPLYQEEAFAAEETVTVFGPRKQMIGNVRILGPLRQACQVELAFSDARLLGIDAPVRLSGNLEGTPGCYLVGPAGGLELPSGVIRAARHVHMHPSEANFYGVAAGDRMKLVVESEQSGVLDGLICRVSESEKLEVHLDTDEGNAVDLVHARKVYLEK